MTVTRDIKGLPIEVREAWRPPERLRPSAWCEDHVRLPIESSPIPGRVSFVTHPYMKEPLDAWVHPDVEEETMMWGTQLGKTTLMLMLMLYTAAVDPGPTLVVGAVQDSMKELSTTRLYKMLRACPETADLMLPEHLQLDLLIDLGAQLIYFGWSGSVTKLGEKAIRYLFNTEVDKWTREKSLEADSLDLAGERTKMYVNRRHMNEGTPNIKGLSRIEALYNLSDRRTFHVPCPHCGAWAPLVFGKRDERGGLKWPRKEDGTSVTPDEARESAWYECTLCSKKIRDADKPNALLRGVWVPAGQRARPVARRSITTSAIRVLTENASGEPMVLEGRPDNPTARHRGYKLNSLYSLALPFGEVAAKWLSAVGDFRSMQNFYNGWLAEAWDIAPDKVQWQELLGRCNDGRPAGLVPLDVEVLIATADVGKHRIHWVLRGWNFAGTSWLIAYGEVGTFEEFDQAVRQTEWHLEGGGVRMVDCIALDARYRTDEVDAYVLKVGPTVRGLMGDTMRQGSFKRFAVQADGVTGKVLKIGYGRWHLNSNLYKERLQSMQSRDVDHPSRWYLHDETDEVYLKSVTAEARVEERDARGRKVFKWHVLHVSPGPHFWDCEYYQVAAHEMWRNGWCRVRRRRREKPRDEGRSRRGAPDEKGLGGGRYGVKL